MGLESFAAPQGLSCVRLVSEEVTALCPVTSQPDWYGVAITYRGLRCLESKSVKLYLNGFREVGLFCEALACRIRDDVVNAIGPECTVLVEVRQRPRGGVAIVAEATHGDTRSFVRSFTREESR